MQIEKVKQFFIKKYTFRFLFQIFILILLVFIVRSCQLSGTASGMAPIISDTTLAGEAVDLKLYRGETVLVYFWATWCPVCKYENSNIDAIAKDHRVITIAYWPESEKEVKTYMQNEKLSMPVIVDSMGEWGKLYGIRGVPVSFIVNSEGNIQFKEHGYTTELGLRLRMWWAGK